MGHYLHLAPSHWYARYGYTHIVYGHKHNICKAEWRHNTTRHNPNGMNTSRQVNRRSMNGTILERLSGMSVSLSLSLSLTCGVSSFRYSTLCFNKKKRLVSLVLFSVRPNRSTASDQTERHTNTTDWSLSMLYRSLGFLSLLYLMSFDSMYNASTFNALASFNASTFLFAC